MRRAAILVIFCITGCGGDLCRGIDGACIDLTVEGSGSVDGLHITLSGAHTREATAPLYPKLSSLPVHLALELTGKGEAAPTGENNQPFRGGSVHVAVVALRGGDGVGRGETDVELGLDEHKRATVQLGAGGGFDFSLPVAADMADTGDLGTPPGDLRSTGDLCTANTNTDPANCGRCGHDCLGGACLDGECQPVVVASMLTQPFGVALDANYFYFSSQTQGLRRVAQTGGAPTAFGPVMGTRSLARFGDNLYYGIESTLGAVVQVAIADATSIAQSTGSAKPIALAGAGSKLYFTTFIDGTIRSVPLPLTGSPVTPTNELTIAGATSLRGLATDGTTLYVSAYSSGGIYAVTIGQTTPMLIANVTLAWGLAIDGRTLWACGNQGLQKIDLDNPGSATVVWPGNIANVAVDAKTVVFVDMGTQKILRLAK